MSKEFLNPDRNDAFHLLRGLDLQDLLVETGNFLLEYREQLNLPKNVTMGAEIEYEFFSRKKVAAFIEKHLSDWISKKDESLLSGGEINSPVMKDEKKYWQELKLICDYLTANKADTFHNAGGHIHIGANILGDDIAAWRIFLKLYAAYEKEWFRFGYGDKLTARSGLFYFAPPSADKICAALPQINREKDLFFLLPYPLMVKKFGALSFKNIKSDQENLKETSTIEFRNFNATTNCIIWQNNINATTKMLLASKKKEIEEEFLDDKLQQQFNCYSQDKFLYNTIDLQNSLEFVDLVFDNNLDKIYFLKQYVKDFEECYDLKHTRNTKKLTK